MDFSVEKVSALQLPLVNRFYKQCRYSAKAGRQEDVFVVRDKSTIIAAVRFSKAQDGFVFLRSFCVDPMRRREGVGRYLLENLADYMSNKNCYCFPFTYLESFYAAAGFMSGGIESMPEFIAAACERYRNQGRDIIIMIKPCEILENNQHV